MALCTLRISVQDFENECDVKFWLEASKTQDVTITDLAEKAGYGRKPGKHPLAFRQTTTRRRYLLILALDITRYTLIFALGITPPKGRNRDRQFLRNRYNITHLGDEPIDLKSAAAGMAGNGRWLRGGRKCARVIE